MALKEADFIDDLKTIGVSDDALKDVLAIHYQNPDLVPYECKRVYNIRMNEEKLKCLNIMSSKPVKTPQKPKVWTPRTPRSMVPIEPSRKSARIAGIQPVVYSTEHVVGEISTSVQRRYKKPKLSFEDISDIASDSAAPILDYVKDEPSSADTKIQKSESNCILEDVRKLCINQNGISKVCKVRLSAMAIHPGNKLLIAGGSKQGEVGLFMPGEKKTTVRLEPHNNVVGDCLFSTCRIYTSSYDGSLRMFDANTLQFDQIYYDEDNVFRGIYLKGDNDLLVASGDGHIVKVDARVDEMVGTYPDSKDAGQYGSLWKVDCNKFDENYFISSSNNGNVVLWDTRNTKSPVDINSSHEKTVSSAVFDPIAGKKILSTAYDDTIAVLDISNKTKMVETKKFSHCNQTGRWLTKFQAKWHPASDEIFAIGSMAQPRRMEIFNINGNMEVTLTNENMNSVQCLVDFHPTINALVGANASGYCYVFDDVM